jgi:hypothetical protein
MTAAMAVGLLFAGAAGAVDLQELVRETQQTRDVENKITFVWWIPQEYWELSLASNPNMGAKEKADFLGALQAYQIVAVAYVKTSLAGFTEISPETDLLTHIHFSSGGKQLDPVPEDKIVPGARAILAALKPLLSGMIGQLGQGMHFIVYPGQDGANRLVDPNKPGDFQYSVFDQDFKWRLPLASLLPRKVDPKSNEDFPGNYDYNPYTGNKLKTR